jgi:hypothetical protein
MPTSPDDAAALAYLEQLQPRDLATLISHAHHDFLMLIGSYTSYFELLEPQLKAVELPDGIANQCCSWMRHNIQTFQHLLDALLNFHEPQLNNADNIGHWKALISHDLRAPVSNFIGWAEVIQYEIETHLEIASQVHIQRLNQAMLATAKRMLTITYAHFLFELPSSE